MIIQGIDTNKLFAKAYNNLIISFTFDKIDELTNAAAKLNLAVNEELSKIDITKCSKEELEEFGFRLWNKESRLMLAPYYWLKLFKKGQVLTAIDNTTITVGKDRIDNDERFGLLAYGIILPDKEDNNAEDKKGNV